MVYWAFNIIYNIYDIKKEINFAAIKNMWNHLFLPFAEYIPEDVLLDIKDKLDDTLSYIYKKYNVEQHTKVACETLKKRWRDICGKTNFYLPSGWR